MAAAARKEAGGRLCAVRADLPGLRQRHRKCVRPRIPGFSPGGLGPHLASSGFPCGLSSGFPFARRVLPLRPPSSWFPFVRRSPVRSLRPLPGFGFPFGVPPVSLPLGNFHDSAAGGAVPQALVPGGKGQGHQSCRCGPLPGSRRDPSRTADGQRPGTRRCRYRIACCERLRALDAAAPEPTRSAGMIREASSDTCLTSVVLRWLGRSVGSWDPA